MVPSPAMRSTIGRYWFPCCEALLKASRVRHGKVAARIPVLFAIVATLLIPQSIAQAPGKEIRRVLFLNIFEPLSSPGVAALDQAIMAGLDKSPYQIELYSEDLDVDLFPDKAAQEDIRDTYIRRYRDRKPDLIIAVGPEPLRFLVESHEKVFTGIPIIFCGSTQEMLNQSKPDFHFTGVWGVAAPEKTLLTALQLRPSTRHVAVVGGSGIYDRTLESIARQRFKSYESKLDLIYLTDLAMPALLDRLKRLPSDTIVYHTAITQDAAGSHFIDATQSVPLVAQAANAPVFVVDDVDIRGGSVGGHVLSFAAQGEIAADMAVRVLKGEKPENIPVVKADNVDMFDWRALQRWGIKERDLPPGSVILHRRPSVWESYKGYIIGGLSLILLELLLIMALVWQRAGRRKVEMELAITNDRLRLAVEAGKSVGWDWDVKTGEARRFGDLETIFGIPTDTHSGNIEEFRSSIYGEDRERVWKAITDAQENGKPYSAEFRVVRRDGTLRWVRAGGKFYCTGPHASARMLGMIVDITDHKLAEEARSSLTGRVIEAQEDERRRIAREIHDDYNQRLAVLAIDLEELAENIGHLNGDASGRLHGLWNTVSELGADLHALSHRLHSSTLESLGLVSGISAFCEEFAYQQGIQVDFAHENVPHRLPDDVALCLFRIVQESLRNIKRHSDANRAEVRLEAIGENLHLSVSDRGRGFDPKARSSNSGIGLRSMEERLRLLGGRLEIHSRPMDGTRIDAWLRVAVAAQCVS